MALKLELQNFKSGMLEQGWISPESQREDAKRVARIMGDEE